jgi:hypothetical protein
MHLVSVCGCPSLVLYSAASNPDLCGQAGPVVRHLRSASGSMDFTPPMVAQAALDLCRNAVKKSPEI